MIHMIDDELEICEITAELLTTYDINPILIHTNWETCEPIAGDIVIHDKHGTGKFKQIEGVQYISISGDLDLNTDISKPFNIEELVNHIKKAA